MIELSRPVEPAESRRVNRLRQVRTLRDWTQPLCENSAVRSVIRSGRAGRLSYRSVAISDFVAFWVDMALKRHKSNRLLCNLPW